MKAKIKAKNNLKIIALILTAVTVLSFFGFSNTMVTAKAIYDSEAHSEVARTIGEEGIVLLKNSGVLPFTKDDSVAGYVNVEGINQVFGGSGSGGVKTTREAIYYKDAMEKAEQNGLIKGFKNCSYVTTGTDANKAMYLISRATAEGTDNELSNYELSAKEKSDIKALVKKHGAENIAVILNVGAVIDTTYLIEQKVGAIVCAYYGGTMAGSSLANVLTGVVSPSGKTVDTWAKSYEDYPSSSIGDFGRQGNVQYTEDIYVGYRYFSTFDPEYEKVNFSFGYGLSYTMFELSDKKISVENGVVTAEVTVKNVGDKSGKEVIQLYYSAPQSASVNGKTIFFGNPARELGGFQKTKLLEPGESQKIKISFDVNDMAVYDDLGKVSKDTYVLLGGEYNFYLGTSLKESGNSFAGYKPYTVSETKMVSDKLTQMTPTTLEKRLLSNGEYEQTNGRTVISGYGETVIQAESFDYKSQLFDILDGDCFYTETAKSIQEFRYLGSVVGNKGLSVEWNVYSEKAGVYNLAMVLASNDAKAYNDVCDVYVNGTKQNVTLNYNGTDGWEVFKYFRAEGTVELPQGNATIKIVNKNGELANLDCFMLYNNSVAAKGTAAIAGETYIGSQGGYVSGDNATTGTINKKGTTLEYDITAEEAGEYYLSVVASNSSKASEKAVNILVNGVSQGDLALMQTCAKSSAEIVHSDLVLKESAAVKVSLKKGANSLKLTTLDSALDTLDKIIISSGKSETKYYDNSAQYSGISFNGTATSLNFGDVLKDSQKLNDFISGLSIRELVAFSGLEAVYGQYVSAGGFGGPCYNGTLSGKGVPGVYTGDASAGVNVMNPIDVTWFPCATMIASTFNTELVKQYGEAAAEEFKSCGFDVWLAPGLNIHRNPLCGRNFEYYSEDPLVAGTIGAAAVEGAQSKKVAVCIKHFFANNQENTRPTSNSCVSNRALREIYLKSFEIVVRKAHPWSIMGSYNLVNGQYPTGTKEIMADILRNEWGFDGVAFTDWGAVEGQTDLLLAGTNIATIHKNYAMVERAYGAGVISREVLENNAKTVANLIIRVKAVSQEDPGDPTEPDPTPDPIPDPEPEAPSSKGCFAALTKNNLAIGMIICLAAVFLRNRYINL